MLSVPPIPGRSVPRKTYPLTAAGNTNLERVPPVRSPTRTDVDGVHALDLNNYVRVVQRHWKMLVLVIAVSMLGSVVAAWAQPKLYRTSTTLVATAPEEVSPQDESTRRQAAAQRAATLAQFAATAPVQQAVITAAARNAGLPARTPDTVVAAADGSTPFLMITVTDEDPRWAQAVANAYRTAMPRALDDIDESVATSAEQVTTLTPAPVPQTPIGPDRTQYLLLGALLGLVLGLGVIVLRESLARHVTAPEDVGRALALPVLGMVPQEEPKRALPMRSAPNSSRAEAYRAVLANLPFLTALDDGPQSLLITSTTGGEGVTTLAGNLAVALARSGRRVLLVDANLRAPRVHEIFDLPAGPGLSEVLAGEATLAEAIHVVDGGSLRVLTAGEPPADPVERLTSAKATALLASIGSEADVVVFDSPPAVPVADALFLARQVSSVILTTRVGTTRKDRLLRAGDALQQVRAPLAGIVVNGTAGNDDRLRPRRRHGRAPVRPTPLSTTRAPAAVQPDGRELGGRCAPAHRGLSRDPPLGRVGRVPAREATVLVLGLVAAFVVGYWGQSYPYFALILALLPLGAALYCTPQLPLALGVAALPLALDVSGGGVQFTVSDLLLTLALAGAVPALLLVPEWRDRARGLAPLLAITAPFAVWLVAVAINHASLVDVLKTGQYYQLFLLPLLLGALVLDRRQARWALTGFVVMAVVLAALWALTGGDFAFAGNKNPAGQYMANAIILVLALAPSWLWRITALIPLVIGLGFTQSRGAIVAAGVGVMVVLLLRGLGSWRRTVAAVVPLAVAAIVGFQFLPADVAARTTDFSTGRAAHRHLSAAEYTVRLREIYREQGWELVNAHPVFGVGPDNYRTGAPGSVEEIFDPHNLIIRTAGEVGYPGLVAFGILDIGSGSARVPEKTCQ